MEIEPFIVDVPQASLDDLAARLARTRWPDEVEGAGWDYGTNLAYLQALVEYWRTRFDWRGQERAMNAFPHFRANVNGLGVHFIHARGQGHRPLPLLVTHGWPSSFVEMLDLIPLLADPAAHGGDPADAFDVVVPSVPGFGFSDRPVRRGMTRSRVAALWLQLMGGLGYERFAAHGNYVTRYDPAYAGAIRRPEAALPRLPLDIRKVIARRAALELFPGAIVNLGFGVSNGIAPVAAEEGIHRDVTLTVEQGIVGGVPAGGNDAGAGHNYDAMVDQPYQFDFYEPMGILAEFRRRPVSRQRRRPEP